VTFVDLPTAVVKLTIVNNAGTQIKITSDDNNIDCGTNCEVYYAKDTNITLSVVNTNTGKAAIGVTWDKCEPEKGLIEDYSGDVSVPPMTEDTTCTFSVVE
jgi:hypothetical protein